jgi:fluoride ion exporter CrcB/FEX
VKSTDDALPSLCSGPQRDRRNQWRIILWAFFWGVFFVATTWGAKREWPLGVTLAGVIATSLFGVAAVLAYRRFLRETDELRRKIEVEALALAFGVGLVGGLTYWLLAVIGAVPEKDFAYVFLVMMIVHPLAVLFGLRRYS